MKRIVSLMLTVVMLCGMVATLSSCGVPKNNGAEISVYLGAESFDFDPGDYFVDNNQEQLMSMIYEPLFGIDEKGNLEMLAAKKYDVDKEEREIVITLRESYWSDEVRVTATDFIYAWRDVILEPTNANPSAALFYDIENAVEVKSGKESLYSFGAVASDIYEITIKYREGADYKQILKNLASIATSPLREDIVSVSPGYWSKSISTIVTNGPFRIEEWNRDSAEFTLSRNLGYHQKPTTKDFDNIVNPGALVSFFTAAGEQLTLTYKDVENKTVFYLADAPVADRIANKDKAEVTEDMSVYSYVFNTENPLFAIKEVRQALSMVLDRTAMSNAIGFGKPANGFLNNKVASSVFKDEIKDRISVSALKEDAEALLAGVNFTGVSKSFTLTVNNDEESVILANMAKEAWESLGFSVTVKTVDLVSTVIEDKATAQEITILDSAIQALVKDASYGDRKFDVIAVDWQLYSEDAFVSLAAFTSNMNGNGVNFKDGTFRTSISGWWNADYDYLMNSAYIAKNEEDRAKALADAEKFLLEYAPVVPVIFNESFAFVNDDISKLTWDYFGNPVFVDVKQKNYEKYLKTEE